MQHSTLIYLFGLILKIILTYTFYFYDIQLLHRLTEKTFLYPIKTLQYHKRQKALRSLDSDKKNLTALYYRIDIQ